MNYSEECLIYDIETPKGAFLLSVYEPRDDKYVDFNINEYDNDLYKMIKYLDLNKDKYWVGYNNINFDSQVIEFIWRTYSKWYELSGLEIAAIIWQFAQDTIDASNFGVFPTYREFELTFKQIDLFRVNHYDNKNRMVSLKRLMYEMDLENIEEFSIDHRKTDFTKEEIQNLIDYCHNDLIATNKFFEITTGRTDHPCYKENDQIALRENIEKEFGVSCLNYSDSKIGDEIVKKYYCEEANVSYKDLPKKGTFRKQIHLKNCIAKYVKFQTKQLQDFHKKIKAKSLKMTDDIDEEISFYGAKYTFKKGGLHTVNKNEIYKSNDKYMILDYDGASFYPRLAIVNGFVPAHLGKSFLNGYIKLYDKRIELKPLSKKDKLIKGIVDALKLSVNAVYGKSSDMQSWLFDKQMTIAICITGELSLMMLNEAYELAGIKVISSNTDGTTVICPREKYEQLLEINKAWEMITEIQLEETRYDKIIFSTVNDYIAIKEGYQDAPEEKKHEYIKKKGDFLTDFELHKNKSFRIIPLALDKYFIDGIHPYDFVKNHKNKYDFCARAKASKDFHYEGINKETGDRTIYNKLIRYYLSTEGLQLLKIKNAECETNAANVSEVNARDEGYWLSTVCNNIKDFNPNIINYDFYLEKIYKFIEKIDKNFQRKSEDINQLSLF